MQNVRQLFQAFSLFVLIIMVIIIIKIMDQTDRPSEFNHLHKSSQNLSGQEGTRMNQELVCGKKP